MTEARWATGFCSGCNTNARCSRVLMNFRKHTSLKQWIHSCLSRFKSGSFLPFQEGTEILFSFECNIWSVSECIRTTSTRNCLSLSFCFGQLFYQCPIHFSRHPEPHTCGIQFWFTFQPGCSFAAFLRNPSVGLRVCVSESMTSPIRFDGWKSGSTGVSLPFSFASLL